jgi:curved DNA-binding protein CbpA
MHKILKNIIINININPLFKSKNKTIFKYNNKTSFFFFKIQRKNFFKKTNKLFHNRSYMYELLGVEKDCTNEQIKEAYIRLARQYHPENNKDAGAIDMFRSLTNAYEALSNQKNRDLYNAYMDLDLYDPDWLIDNHREKFENQRDDYYYSKFNTGENSREKSKGNSNGFSYSNSGFNNYNFNYFSKDFENVFNSGYKEPKKLKAEDIEVSKK